MQNLITTHASRPKSAKKVWIKPEVEIIDTDYIQSGIGPKGTEGRLTVFPGNGNRYHTS